MMNVDVRVGLDRCRSDLVIERMVELQVCVRKQG